MTLVIETKANPGQAERRRSPRHPLCLDAEAALADDSLPVQLHELSRSGFLMECKGALAAGEPFEIRLAGSGAYRARAIWTCGSLVGCEFQHSLSASACSAAMLKARPKKPAQSPMWWIDDVAADGERASEAQASGKDGYDLRLTVGLSIALWATLGIAASYLLT